MVEKRVIGFDCEVDIEGIHGKEKKLDALFGDGFSKVRDYVEKNGFHIANERDTSVSYRAIRNALGGVHHTEPYQTVNGSTSTFLLRQPEHTIVRFVERAERSNSGLFDIGNFLGYNRRATSLAVETFSSDEELEELFGFVGQSIEEESLCLIDRYLSRENEELRTKINSARGLQNCSDTRQYRDVFRKFHSEESARETLREIHIRPILLLGQKYDSQKVVNRATEVLESRDLRA
jgi:hypothetical protein